MGEGRWMAPPLSSILKLFQLSSIRQQGGRDEACLSSQGWSALGGQVAAGGLELWRERLPYAFHPGTVLPLSSLWPMAGVSWTWIHVTWPRDTSDKMCFLGSGGLYLVVSALCLQCTFLSSDSRQKGQMQKRNGGKVVDERQLFHGTSTVFVDAICQQNFDWRVCGLHGTSYGKGKGEGSLCQQKLALLHCPGPRKPF